MQNKEETKSTLPISPEPSPGLKKVFSGPEDENAEMSQFDPFANTIFDDICKLQDLIQIESELK